MYISDGGVWPNLAANLHQIFKVSRHQNRKTRINLRQLLICSYLHFSKSMIKHCNSILAPLNWYVRVPNADNSKMVAESAMKSSRLPEKSCVELRLVRLRVEISRRHIRLFSACKGLDSAQPPICSWCTSKVSPSCISSCYPSQ